jgi:hypothetical protein
VDEAREHEPALGARCAQRLRRLERVVELRETDVRIRVVDQLRQRVEGGPDAHPPAPQRQVLRALPAHEVDGLAGVVQPVELPHAGRGGGVVAEGGLGFRGAGRLHGRRVYPRLELDR